MDIQIDKFKDYKVIKDPKSAQLVDSSINNSWWQNDGWSTMYDMDVEDFKEILPSWGGGISRGLETLRFKQPSKITNKLQGVFDFLDKKEGKPNPLKAEAESKEAFSDPKALYVGKLGFGYINDQGDVETFPYPASGLAAEYDGENKPYITDVKDGGVVVWDDSLEKEIIKKYSGENMSEEEEYII
jgi:hypothetical protein|tara:strand:- start:46 stop:603 length:558 start_codon:yes stop_codon:yes gene_type:complete